MPNISGITRNTSFARAAIPPAAFTLLPTGLPLAVSISDTATHAPNASFQILR
nr:hypothetical protein [Neisseria dentiae]